MKGIVKGIPKNFQQNFVGSIINFAIDTGTKGHEIPIIFSPEGLSDSIQASYSQTTIPGASAPQITYTATGARTVSFNIVLPLDYLPPNSVYKDFEDYLNAFRALVYPKYASSGGKVESPHCKLTTSNIEIDGVCNQCSIEYKTDRFAQDGSMSANISLGFIEVLDASKADAKWIANSKVNILKDTVVTTQTSSEDNFISQTLSNKNVSDDKCYITLIGGNMSLEYRTASLVDMSKDGTFVDPGVKYTQPSKYAIKKFYVRNAYNIKGYEVSDINTSNLTCVIGGQRVNMHTGLMNFAFDSDGSVNLFVIYVPVYDGNKYEVNSAKYRRIEVKEKVA